MQVTMTMEEYNELMTVNAKHVEQLNKLMDKHKNIEKEYLQYKAISEIVINFFKDNDITCVDQISQSDRVLEKLEGFTVSLFEKVEDLMFDAKVEECYQELLKSIRE